MLSINPWNFSQDDMTLICSEFSEPAKGHSGIDDMPQGHVDESCNETG